MEGPILEKAPDNSASIVLDISIRYSFVILLLYDRLGYKVFYIRLRW